MGIPTWDLEAVNWTIPTAIGFYDGQEYHEFIRKSEEDDVLWRFLCFLKDNYKGIKLYAHCSSQYDSKFILAKLCEKEEVVDIEAGLIKLRWHKPNICFEDSYPLVTMRLEKAAKMFEVEEKKEWKHETTLMPWEMGEQLSTFREYLKQDCLTLSAVMEKFCETVGYSFGITPSITLPTTAAKAFSKCFFNLDDINSNEEFDQFIREATYGGRNEVYKRYGENIRLYDVNAMFVSCYDVEVPVGPMGWCRPNINRGTMAEVSVKVPRDMYIGPLPYRMLDGRLIFPVGEFSGWYDMTEIRYAIQLGVDVTIRRQLEAKESVVLKDFGQFASKMKENATEKMREFWKMMGLSVIGKLGQSRWRDAIKHASQIEDYTGCAPLDKEEFYFTYREYVKGRAPYLKPAVSMRVRSEARVRHLNLLLHAHRKGEVFYGDTDSIYTTSEMTAGTKTGQLVYAGVAERGYFIKQKLYALIKNGKLNQRSAGYSDTSLLEEDFKDLLEGKEVKKTSIAFPPYKKIFSKKEMDLLERPLKIRGDLGVSRNLVNKYDTEPIELTLRLGDSV